MWYTKKKWLCASESEKAILLTLPAVLCWIVYDLDEKWV